MQQYTLLVTEQNINNVHGCSIICDNQSVSKHTITVGQSVCEIQVSESLHTALHL